MRTPLALALLCGLTFFAGLGRPAIADSDEAFYAESAREMIETGDWITPHYNYEFRFQKPILFYWFVAGAYLVAGVGEAAARFPSALAGLGLALVTWLCARRGGTPGAARLAGAIVATNFGYFAMARQSLPDLPLALFVTLAIWTGLEALADREAAPADRPFRLAWLGASASSLAAAFLTKGPVGILLPALVIAPIVLIERRRSPASRPRPAVVRVSDAAVAAAIFLVLAAPWYAAMARAHGPSYLTNFFVGENVERFATDRFNEPRALWFYGPIVLAGLLPWSAFAPLGLAPLVGLVRRRIRLSPRETRLLVWAGLPLLFFTISIGKQPRYILPVLPPLAILLAQGLHDRATRGGAAASRAVAPGSNEPEPLAAGRRAFAACGVLAGILLVTLGGLIHRASPLLTVVNPGWIGLAAIAIAGCGLGVVAVALARPRRLPLAITGASAVTLLALQYFVLSSSAPEPVQHMAAAIQAHRTGGEPVGPFRVFVRNLVFYTGVRQADLYDEARAVAFLQSAEPVLGVFAEDDLSRMEREAGVRTRRLASVRYFNPVGLKLRMLLWPDPDNDVETVVLVTNR